MQIIVAPHTLRVPVGQFEQRAHLIALVRAGGQLPDGVCLELRRAVEGGGDDVERERQHIRWDAFTRQIAQRLEARPRAAYARDVAQPGGDQVQGYVSLSRKSIRSVQR